MITQGNKNSAVVPAITWNSQLLITSKSIIVKTHIIDFLYNIHG